MPHIFLTADEILVSTYFYLKFKKKKRNQLFYNKTTIIIFIIQIIWVNKLNMYFGEQNKYKSMLHANQHWDQPKERAQFFPHIFPGTK